jgi:hypothetical protein
MPMQNADENNFLKKKIKKIITKLSVLYRNFVSVPSRHIDKAMTTETE